MAHVIQSKTPQPEIAAKIIEYLHKARRDRFNTHNFPIRADRIAEDLGLPIPTVVASAERLVRQHELERIDKPTGLGPSYRALSPTTETEKQFVRQAKRLSNKHGNP